MHFFSDIRTSLISGKAKKFDDVELTAEQIRVGGFVAVQEPGIKEPWYLATNCESDAKSVIELYGRRFTIEENSGISTPNLGQTL